MATKIVGLSSIRQNVFKNSCEFIMRPFTFPQITLFIWIGIIPHIFFLNKPLFSGLFKNAQMLGARSHGSEAYFLRTPQRLKAAAQRSR
jgi:hypothetical protein